MAEQVVSVKKRPTGCKMTSVHALVGRECEKMGAKMTQPFSWKSWLSEWVASWRSGEPARVPAQEKPLPEPPPSGRQKLQRNRRREALYAVVREAMIRAGVLSSAYKFKVLTLDHEGLTHLVLVDLKADALRHVHGGQSALENGMRQLAQERAQLAVKSVYWRIMEGSSSPSVAPMVAPTNVEHGVGHEEITHDELAALHQALSGRAPAAADTPDFAPTQPMIRRSASHDHPLSDTQMGDLR